jgi:hypothetical protein
VVDFAFAPSTEETPAAMETAQLRQQLNDLAARADALRRYL